ncbi:MAG: DUF6886 family protein [Pseudobdellovibrionaceae bacterium]
MPQFRLFHASEEAGIQVFKPRQVPSPDTGIQGLAVWAIDEAHLPNYLLPRDCPRVTYAAAKQTSNDDRQKFLTGTTARRVIALESQWFSKIESCQLFVYELPTETFELVDAGAGYYISRAQVIPKSVTKIKDIIPELLNRNIEVRFLPQLWDLKEAVAASSLEFSIIRFRNASARTE